MRRQYINESSVFYSFIRSTVAVVNAILVITKDFNYMEFSDLYFELETNSAIDVLRVVEAVFENLVRRRMKCTSFIGCLTVLIGCIEDLFE